MENKWMLEDCPAERVITKTAASVTNAELLSAIIGGNDQRNMDIARNILTFNKNRLSKLAGMTCADLLQFKGMTRIKAARVSAAFELNKRNCREINYSKTFTTSKDVAELFQNEIGHLEHEVLMVALFTQRNTLIHEEVLFIGSTTGVYADPMRVAKLAILYNAPNVAVSHNHPSENMTPSKADQTLTQSLKQGLAFLNIKLLDHIIVCKTNDFYSFADEGLL